MSCRSVDVTDDSIRRTRALRQENISRNRRRRDMNKHRQTCRGIVQENSSLICVCRSVSGCWSCVLSVRKKILVCLGRLTYRQRGIFVRKEPPRAETEDYENDYENVNYFSGHKIILVATNHITTRRVKRKTTCRWAVTKNS